MKTPHSPVLLTETVQVLAPHQGEAYLDGTAGFGGHAAAIREVTGPGAQIILVDRDANAVQALAETFGETAQIIHASYLEAAQRLQAEGVLVNMILLDLGVSSPQIDNPERGFSFRAEAALDMRMDQSQPLTAEKIVNGYDIRDLTRIIREYGEEPKAAAVARAIVAARPILSTTALAGVVRRAALGGGDIDSATRTFQAIRIEVNAELEQLRAALPVLTKLLAPGGRLAVISFHSLEDRIVKQYFDLESHDCICPPKQPVCTCDHVRALRRLTKGPVMGSSTELAINPRARSAKLRAAEKINKNKRRD